MKTSLFSLFTTGLVLVAPGVVIASGDVRFVVGEGAPADRFGSEGPLLLALGCIAILVIYGVLVSASRRHRQAAGRLDAIEKMLTQEAPRDET
jgi:hypothetical protein